MIEVSKEQQLYISKYQHRKNWIRLFRISILILFLLVWEISTCTGMIDSFIFSSPSKVIRCFWQMIYDKTLFLHVGITLYETLISFFLVTIISILFATILWLNSGLSEIFDPYLVVLNSLPKSALAPLLIVWLGANQTSIIIAGMSVAIFGSILGLYSSFQTIDPAKLTLISTLGGTNFHALSKVVIPSNIPAIISTMKVNIGLCLVGVIIGEFIGGRMGLGYLIIYASQVFTCAHILKQFDIVIGYNFEFN